MQARGPSSKAASTQVVYTDGACSKNGRRGAIAGCCEHCRLIRTSSFCDVFTTVFHIVCRYGVFFGTGDPRNVSAALKGPVQTNNRAEMTAVLEALKVSVRSFLLFRSSCYWWVLYWTMRALLYECDVVPVLCMHLQVCCKSAGLKHICLKSDSQYTVALACCRLLAYLRVALTIAKRSKEVGTTLAYRVP